MNKTNKYQKIILCCWVTIPALIPLIFLFIVYKYGFYGYDEVSYGFRYALGQIHEYYPWYRYSVIVFFLAYVYSGRLLSLKQENYIGLYFSVLGIYVISTFFSILLYLPSLLIFEIYTGGATWGIDWPDLIYFVVYAFFLTVASFTGSADLYAPYALPSVVVSIFVTLALVRYKRSLKSAIK